MYHPVQLRDAAVPSRVNNPRPAYSTSITTLVLQPRLLTIVVVKCWIIGLTALMVRPDGYYQSLQPDYLLAALCVGSLLIGATTLLCLYRNQATSDTEILFDKDTVVYVVIGTLSMCQWLLIETIQIRALQ
jgi:hypothetical protein